VCVDKEDEEEGIGKEDDKVLEGPGKVMEGDAFIVVDKSSLQCIP
jgi:hypothetical protein